MRRWLIRILVAVLVLAGVGALVFRQQVGDVYGYLFPGGIVDDALDRTSDPAPTIDGPPLPEATDEPPTSDEPPAVELEQLAELDLPSAVVDPLGAGPVLVSTLGGLVHLVDLGSGDTEVVLDLTDRVSTGGERGLLGMAADPDGERLYLDFTDTDGDTRI
ncbi:MAG TPA: hypothetical protein VFV32_06535, partial [Acidimicrobiales bacterium]|nr:hypothetical protein [Acidimicrobiales bacterium]